MEVVNETAKRFLPTTIHLNESWELNHWCEELNLRAEELKEIVRKVGPKIDDVRDFLVKRNMNREANY